MSVNEIMNIIHENLMSRRINDTSSFFPLPAMVRMSPVEALFATGTREAENYFPSLITHPVSSRSHHRMELIAMEWRVEE